MDIIGSSGGKNNDNSSRELYKKKHSIAMLKFSSLVRIETIWARELWGEWESDKDGMEQRPGRECVFACENGLDS